MIKKIIYKSKLKQEVLLHNDTWRIYFIEGDVNCNENRKTIKITVKNTGDRPCQIGSHTHFFEINKALIFRAKKHMVSG